MSTRPSRSNLVAGVVVFALTLGAWLYAELNGIDSGPLFYMAVPVVGAMFLVSPVNKAADAAQQAATQTNGGLESRIKAAVSSALADRDKARTRQAMGDIGAEQLEQLAAGDTPPA